MTKLLPKYPVYVPSKGRADRCLTARVLLKDGVDFRLVVEPPEASAYAAKFGRGRLLVLPFHDLGLGSIPARNWLWQHSLDSGHARHWCLDDNMMRFRRVVAGQRIPCLAGAALRACEVFVNRYENVAVAGPNHNGMGFSGTLPPFFLNVHVYSCLLILNSLPFRWRGRYNEDTDLCLQALSSGWCTVLMNAFLMHKARTLTMPGGNTDALYRGDGRLRMARSLERLWPGAVSTRRKFGRAQHHVRAGWRGFNTPLVRRKDIDWAALEGMVDEMGMTLVQVKPQVRSAAVRALLDKYGRPAAGAENAGTGP